jgi:hypothetical protein
LKRQPLARHFLARRTSPNDVLDVGRLQPFIAPNYKEEKGREHPNENYNEARGYCLLKKNKK